MYNYYIAKVIDSSSPEVLAKAVSKGVITQDALNIWNDSFASYASGEITEELVGEHPFVAHAWN